MCAYLIVHMKLNVLVNMGSTTHTRYNKYDKRSVVYLDSKLWKSRPIRIKDAISLTDFKERNKSKGGPCDCLQCISNTKFECKWGFYIINDFFSFSFIL